MIPVGIALVVLGLFFARQNSRGLSSLVPSPAVTVGLLLVIIGGIS